MANTNEKDKNVIEKATDSIQDKIEEKKEEREIEKRTDTLKFDDYVIEKIAALAARDIPGVLELKDDSFQVSPKHLLQAQIPTLRALALKLTKTT